MGSVAQKRAVWIAYAAAAALALGGMPVVIVRSCAGGALAIVCACLYGALLTGGLAVKALAGAFRVRGRGSFFTRLAAIMDYAIAFGTLLPVALVLLGGAPGWTAFGVSLALAALAAAVHSLGWPIQPWLMRMLRAFARCLPVCCALCAVPRSFRPFAENGMSASEYVYMALGMCFYAMADASRPDRDETGWADFVGCLCEIAALAFQYFFILLFVFGG